MRYDFPQYIRDRDSGLFGNSAAPAHELYFVQLALDAGELTKSEYQRLRRRQQTLEKRIRGEDARWGCGIGRGGLSREAKAKLKSAKAVLQIKKTLEMWKFEGEWD